jgi:type IV pilus assembly protein PilO
MAKSFNDLSPRAQLIAFVVLCVFAIGGAWQVLLSPTRLDVAAHREQLTGLESKVASARAVAARLPAARQEVAALEQALLDTTAVIPDEKDPQDVLRNLHALASESLLDIAKFTPKPVVAKPQYSEWPIELSFEGGYHDLGVFFDRIAGMSRLMSVSDLTIKTRQRPDARGSVTATCVATTFVFRKDTPTPVTSGGRP